MLRRSFIKALMPLALAFPVGAFAKASNGSDDVATKLASLDIKRGQMVVLPDGYEIGYTCEVCGDLATHGVGDVTDLGVNEAGWLMSRIASRHYLCDAHIRQPIVRFADGRISNRECGFFGRIQPERRKGA